MVGGEVRGVAEEDADADEDGDADADAGREEDGDEDSDEEVAMWARMRMCATTRMIGPGMTMVIHR